MAKIPHDKYYTPQHIVDLVIQRTKEVIGLENITEFIEPSAGNGAFLDKLYELGKPVYAYDLYPEREDIKEQDFLKLEKKYVKSAYVITNPPYGRCLSLAQKFYKKSIEIADYISFILPISQLNNNNSMYEFDLIHSEDLGKKLYTDRYLHCCLNIYARPKKGLNDKPITKLKDVEIIRQDSAKYKDIKEDIRMCYWGDGSAGKILKEGESYSGEYKIVVHNEKYKYRIIDIIKNYNWKEETNSIAMRRIKQWQIINILKKEISELE